MRLEKERNSVKIGEGGREREGPSKQPATVGIQMQSVDVLRTPRLRVAYTTWLMWRLERTKFLLRLIDYKLQNFLASVNKRPFSAFFTKNCFLHNQTTTWQKRLIFQFKILKKGEKSFKHQF